MSLNNQHGFTLIETLVIIAIMAILSAIAIPSFSTWKDSSQDKSIAREILYGLRTARSLAINQNRKITVTVDLDNHQLSYDTTTLNFSDQIKIEADSVVTSLVGTGTRSVIFQPRGESSSELFIRVNEKPNLTIQLDLTGISRL
ncbi:MAG: hypothetical protein DRH07_07530 [Deltaproteobacteria bacterium]|nr:MAG: hypothetical protein DRH07_07530 [Deltaproteobacteria bacterium]